MITTYFYSLFVVHYCSTPDKVYYSKLRAAFATPGTTAHPAPIGSYSRANDSDLPFVLMMQQQENSQQQTHQMDHDPNQSHPSKANLYIGGDVDNETAPDDFILVEVVSKLSFFCNFHFLSSLLETILRQK